MAKRRYALSIHITSIFVMISFVLGGGLIAIGYQHSQKLIEHSARQISIQHSHKLESVFQHTISPILTTLDLMATSSLSSYPPESGKLNIWTDSIQMIFDRNPNLTGLFYGSHDGSFTQFRPMNERISPIFRAPPSTKLLINYYKANRDSTFHYIGNGIHLIEKQQNNESRYDPRTRPWYLNASPDGKIGLSEPYLFYFLDEIGVTLSRMSLDGNNVVAADFTLNSLSQQLRQLATSRESKLAIFDIHGQLLAQHNMKNSEQADTSLSDTIFAPYLQSSLIQGYYTDVDFDDQQWLVAINPVNLTDKVQLLLAEATPKKVLMAELITLRNEQIMAAILMVVLSFSVIWYAALKITRPLNKLTELTKNVRSFNFRKIRYPESVIKEVNKLSESVQLMEHTLFDLLKLLRETAKQNDFGVLSKTICQQTYIITKAETIVLLTKEDHEKQFSVVTDHCIIPLKLDINQLLNDTPWIRSKLTQGDEIVLTRDDNSIKPLLDQFYNSELYLFPMMNREKDLIGILSIGYERNDDLSRKDKHAYLRELLGFAEIAKDNIAQMQKRKAMFNSFIELIASAIDTKSPYTGGHCQRVPIISELLVKAADEDTFYFPDFSMNKHKWEELHFAAWLHDSGKVTTPEFIVDKATKLETIYDRIHEIRMRFELLKSEAEMNYYRELYQGGNKEFLKSRLDNIHRQIDDDFAFIARCNQGLEELTEDDLLRLDELSNITWTRTIDDTLGVSWVEKERSASSQQLPVKESLLSDKEIHKIPWEEGFNPKETWQEQFNLSPTNLQYHKGELYNLKISYGTLNQEERFIINDHIIQTITMLDKLPYPEHLKSVPDIAGSHHERMDGKGYPRGLKAGQLSIQARAIAIADIFEALTSSDRPYKKTHTIDQAFEIMTQLATSGHIDPKLYLLFLKKTIDKVYSDDYMEKQQDFSEERNNHINKIQSYIEENAIS